MSTTGTTLPLLSVPSSSFSTPSSRALTAVFPSRCFFHNSTTNLCRLTAAFPRSPLPPSSSKPSSSSSAPPRYSSSYTDSDPPEAAEDSSHGVSRIQQFQRQVTRARKVQEEQYEKEKHLFASALALEHDAPDDSDSRISSSGDDFFGDIDRAIATKRKEFVEQGLLKPSPRKNKNYDDGGQQQDSLTPEELKDLDEINELQQHQQGLISNSEKNDDDDDVVEEEEKDGDFPSDGFDIDLDGLVGTRQLRLAEPSLRMTVAELLDESRIVPLSVYGDLEVEITGIQHDCREVDVGDLFVSCVDLDKDGGRLLLSEADKRGAIAVVATKEINIDETLGCKALVVVEDTDAVVPVLAASFYGHPSRSMSVIGIAGTNGKSTTSYLCKALYEGMSLRAGMLTNLGCFVHGDNKVDESPGGRDAAISDMVIAQRLMAKMVYNETEAMVMEVSSQGLIRGIYNAVDIDVAVFTSLTGDDGLDLDEHNRSTTTAVEECRDSIASLFARMVDPERHRKVVNIDDPSAPFFLAQGNAEVPVVTFAMENRKSADVYPLKYDLSLFETQVLVQTPKGILEISSGLLGKFNIYNILAAVAVGIAVEAPLGDIVRGIEEVDLVPGRCELIDEEQDYAVIVDHARTPGKLSGLLDSVRELGNQRVITVVGCEGEKDFGKRPMMAKIATEKSDVVILTSDNPRKEDPLDILDDMLAGIGWTMAQYLDYGKNDYYPPLPNGHRLFVHDMRKLAISAAVGMSETGDIVVIAGKGEETYQIEGDEKTFFDDRDECREALHFVDEIHLSGIDTSEIPWRLPESY